MLLQLWNLRRSNVKEKKKSSSSHLEQLNQVLGQAIWTWVSVPKEVTLVSPLMNIVPYCA